MRFFPGLFIPVILPLVIFSQNELPQFKAAPTRPSADSEVVIEWVDVLDECFEEKICVQGHLKNQGKKAAYQVKLRIEIGGTKHSKPRITLHRTIEQTVMQPGDQQDFDLTIDRKIPYKDAKGEDKIIEVGKFNFKVVPTWSKPAAKKPPLAKKPKPASSKTSAIKTQN